MTDIEPDDIPQGITLPADMPIPVLAMLQTTITEAWEDYDGSPDDPEEFWDFLADLK